MSFNDFRVAHLHSNADNGTLLVVGEKAFGNRMQFTLGVDQGVKGITGVVLGGRRNVIELGKRGCNQLIPKGRALILAETAEGDQLHVVDSELDDPHDIVADRARASSNQLTWTGPALPIRTLENVGRDCTHTQRLYPATLHWSGGLVDRVTLVRGDQRLDFGKDTDRELLLSVGDQLRLQSSTPPTGDLIPLKSL